MVFVFIWLSIHIVHGMIHTMMLYCHETRPDTVHLLFRNTKFLYIFQLTGSEHSVLLVLLIDVN